MTLFSSLSPPLHHCTCIQTLPNTPYVLEELVTNISEEASSVVKLQLLTAVMKMFMKRPPECQEMLGRLLEHVIGEGKRESVRWQREIGRWLR